MRFAFPRDEKGKVAVSKCEELMQRYRFVLTDSEMHLPSMLNPSRLTNPSSEVMQQERSKDFVLCNAAGPFIELPTTIDNNGDDQMRLPRPETWQPTES